MLLFWNPPSPSVDLIRYETKTHEVCWLHKAKYAWYWWSEASRWRTCCAPVGASRSGRRPLATVRVFPAGIGFIPKVREYCYKAVECTNESRYIVFKSFHILETTTRPVPTLCRVVAASIETSFWGCSVRWVSTDPSVDLGQRRGKFREEGTFRHFQKCPCRYS